MPSVLGQFLKKRETMIPTAISFHGGSSSHRLKQLEKWNRRAFAVLFGIRETFFFTISQFSSHYCLEYLQTR
ncbi:hypothetical protein H6P81_006522 [Aristolochia fimbriata]|uniref:Uncharacterized protein n=1 Tax=Aristolochia fimbriata TaxID=158543 RepID=A0AAV7F225_ARIFI|nr:hypothetical protein H6P81_006522 [Aristolochia fimbriata]